MRCPRAGAARMSHTPHMPQAARHTWDDFIALDGDDRRELIDGELLELEMPTDVHERIIAVLSFFLETWARRVNGGITLGSGYKVRISPKRGVMPDLQFFRRDNIPRDQPQGLEVGRPDLVVEVISPRSARYDRVVKLAYYASIGVPEYWIVDVDARTVERLVLAGEHYLIAYALSDDSVLAPDTFPGLEVPLAEVWRSVDELRGRPG